MKHFPQVMAQRSVSQRRRRKGERNKAEKREFVDWVRSTRMRMQTLADVLWVSKRALADRVSGWGPKPKSALFIEWLGRYLDFVDQQLEGLDKLRVRLIESEDEYERCQRFAAWLDATGLTQVEFAMLVDANITIVHSRYRGGSRFQPGEIDEWLPAYERFLLDRQVHTKRIRDRITRIFKID